MSALFTSGGLICVFCEEPTHFGAGRKVGLVDLPIQRSALTDLPIGQASSIRGMLRSFLELSGQRDLAREAFGAEPGEVPARSGRVDISDAKLLLMPVRSVVGLFCWLTCPACLNELQGALRRLKEVTGGGLHELKLPCALHDSIEAVLKAGVAKGTALVPSECENVVKREKEERLLLLDGEMDLRAEAREEVDRLSTSLSELIAPFDGYLVNVFRRRFAVVEDDVFKLATKRGLEVATRIRTVYETKTVERGGLWSEEYLPAYSLLFSEVYFHSRLSAVEKGAGVENFIKLMNAIDGKHVFIGGKEGVGKGLVKLKAYYRAVQLER
ncbi:MAG: type III-B CRISPR module RAMP protein Cmr4 [Candidatus Nezhaarchaeota archaeon]|nr:type III-B CRISPR module RAMP protein Cmr4 [Candidatus Nezhaarchaeota archaeon]